MPVLRSRTTGGGLIHGVNLRTRVGGAVESAVLPPGRYIPPYHWWKCEESGAAQRVDTMGNDNLFPAGTVSQATGYIDNCAATTGTASYMLAGSGRVTGDGPFTVAGWFYRNTNTDADQAWILLEGAHASDIKFAVKWTQAAAQANFTDVVLDVRDDALTSYQDNVNPFTLVLERWYLVSVVYDGINRTVLTIFDSETGASTDAVIAGVVPNTAPQNAFNCMGSGINAQYTWEGRMDELKVWHQELTLEQIRDQMAA